jgi:Raf kinase inhibitor-like YbhB/YbcL family protein
VRRWPPLIASIALLAGCGGGEGPAAPLPAAPAKLRLSSPAFGDGGPIPVRFTCDGRDVSPPLRIAGTPRRARELALVVEDPDAGRFVHWTLLRVPAGVTRIREGRVPPRAIETTNGFGDRGWGGPCPPEGDPPHRYVFAAYALSRSSGLGAHASAEEVRARLAADARARHAHRQLRPVGPPERRRRPSGAPAARAAASAAAAPQRAGGAAVSPPAAAPGASRAGGVSADLRLRIWKARTMSVTPCISAQMPANTSST